ncbi:MAG: roadblock/LC7 domain-containing protein [Thermoplasmatota archaeon]
MYVPLYYEEREIIKAQKQVEEIFEEYCEENEIEGIALTSKNGIPIASYLDKPEQSESFSTLSATIMGASEVIFSSFEKSNPDLITANSGDSILMIKEMGTNAVLSVIGDLEKKNELKDKIDEIIEEIDVLEKASEIKEVLEK